MSDFTNSSPQPTMKEWVAALRSGEYQQGQGFLNKESSFCCLGVYCDMKIGYQWTPRQVYEHEIVQGIHVSSHDYTATSHPPHG